MHPYLITLYYLLITDYQIFKRTIVDKIINLLIWVSAMTLVTSYLMPSFGLSKDYGNFMLASLVASAGLFEAFPSIVNLISDFEGNNITSFYLTLPIPSWLVFVKHMIFYAFNLASMALWVLPLGKLLLFNRFSFAHFNFIQFCIIFILICFFYATFTIWTASKLMRMEKIQNLWMRFIFPLWFLGCYQYSFKVLHNVSPVLAYASFLNPMTYIMEGTRAAVLGQEQYLNFWFCAGALIFFIVLCGWRGIANMKKRLDF